MYSYLCIFLLALTCSQVVLGSQVNIIIGDSACKGLLVNSKKLYVVTAGHCVLSATHGIQTRNILLKIGDQTYLREIQNITFSNPNFKSVALPLLLTGKKSDVRNFCIHHHQNDIALIELTTYKSNLNGYYIYSKDELTNYSRFDSSHFSIPQKGLELAYIFKERTIDHFSTEEIQHIASFTSQSESIFEGDSGSPLIEAQNEEKKESKIVGVASCYTSNTEKTIKYNKFAVWNQRLQTALEN